MKIIRELRNDSGGLYAVWIAVDNCGQFIRELWAEASEHGPRTDEDACGEWTDRARDFRTTVCHEGVFVRTHAWHPQGDKKELHPDVLRFLESRGIDTKPTKQQEPAR